MKKYNIVTGTIFLLIAIGAYEIGTSFVAKLPTDPLGTAWWPECLSIALGIFSILLILQGVLTPKSKDKPAPIHFKSEGFHRVVKLSGVLIIFAAITYFLGIYIGLLLMVPTVMYLLGERKKLILAVFSVSTCLFVFMIFKLLLMVPLPTGLLFD